MLHSTWTLEDVDDVEGLVNAVINLYLGRRGAHLRGDQRDELHAYLLGETWRLYVKYDRRRQAATFRSRLTSFAASAGQ